MCDNKPGERCASDSRDEAAQSFEDYLRAWKGGTPVNAVAAAREVFENSGAQDNAAYQPVPLRGGDPRMHALRFAGEYDKMADRAEGAGDYDLAARLRVGAGEYRRQAGVGSDEADISSLEARLAEPSATTTTGSAAMAGQPGSVLTAARPTAPPIETYGPVHRQHGPFPADGTWNVPDDSVNEVAVVNDGHETVFTRRTGDNSPGVPDAIRIEADRELSNDEIRQMAGLVGYAHRSELRGYEGVSAPYRDGPNSFVVYRDGTKTSGDRAKRHERYERFEDVLPTFIREGTPERRTNQAGEGTKGTRAVQGVGDVTISIWYDDVTPRTQP